MTYPLFEHEDPNTTIRHVLAVMRIVADKAGVLPANVNYEPCLLFSAEYEEFVERPRRRGKDPVWESLLAEALNHQPEAEQAA